MTYEYCEYEYEVRVDYLAHMPLNTVINKFLRRIARKLPQHTSIVSHLFYCMVKYLITSRVSSEEFAQQYK